MSTTTGNVKISELAELSTIHDGAKLKIPVSNTSGSTSTPNWESYGVTAKTLSNFFGTSLGISGSEGLNSKVQILREQLAQYNEENVEDFSIAETGKYFSTSGEKVTLEGFSISNPISLKQGYLYMLSVPFSISYPTDISIMTKVDVHTYRTPSGTTGTDTVYEPLPNVYSVPGNSQNVDIPPINGIPVFFATENMDVVISCETSGFPESSPYCRLTRVKYGVFLETAAKLLTVNGELMKVLVEAIVKNKKDIDSINENMKSLGDVHANSIDLDDFPSVQGEPMVVVADRRPSAAGTNHGDDVPNRIGQIWVDTTNKQAYIAVALGSTGDASWKQITV